MTLSIVNYDRSLNQLLFAGDTSTQLPLTGTLISYTRIYATRPGFVSPLVIGLLYCHQTKQHVQGELVDVVFEQLKSGLQVKSALRLLYGNNAHNEPHYVLKWKVVDA